MANVLLAPVGESPAAITYIYEALQRHPDGPQVKIDKVVLIYPHYGSSRLIDLGIELIKSYLDGKCDVDCVPLSFEDVNDREHSIKYLEVIGRQLHRNKNNHVYVSVAGGRKNMAALTTVMTQFFDCVKGVYHVIDMLENEPAGRHFLTIEEFLDKDANERKEKMTPILDDIALIQLPHRTLTDHDAWLACWSAMEKGKQIDIPTQGAAAAFFTEVFGGISSVETLHVRLSSAAKKDFDNLGSRDQQRFLSHLEALSRRDYLSKYGRERYKSGFKTDCIVFPGQKTPDPIRIFLAWDQGSDTVNIIRIFLHKEYDRISKPGRSVMKGDYPPEIPLESITVREGTLMVTVGLSPMVVTQLFELLKTRGHVRIRGISVLYPEENGDVCNGVRLLKNLFENKRIMKEIAGEGEKIAFREHPIPINDLDSQAACDAFGKTLQAAINKEKNLFPQTPIYLSFAGGRKGMAAYVYYAAQSNGLSEVYHTTISDPELEKQVEMETGCKYMENKGWDLRTKAEHLFLRKYSDRPDAFHLVPIPVVPLV